MSGYVGHNCRCRRRRRDSLCHRYGTKTVNVVLAHTHSFAHSDLTAIHLALQNPSSPARATRRSLRVPRKQSCWGTDRARVEAKASLQVERRGGRRRLARGRGSFQHRREALRLAQHVQYAACRGDGAARPVQSCGMYVGDSTAEQS